MNDGDRAAAVAETHVSVLVFAGNRAYKLKKPVALGFLDFSTRQAREAACRREVEPNRRLAPDVYLGVADVSGPDGNPCDYLVVMRRMPAGRRLAALVRAMAPLVGPVLEPELASRAGLARRYLAGRGALLEHRAASGMVRDGHGDLLAEDIFLLDDGPRVLDCIEFDDRLRYGDVLADVAFLAMDLERLGAPRLAAQFLDCYREFSGHPHPASLMEHYVAYRAHVRAKVACLRHQQGDGAAAGEAAALLSLAVRHLERGRSGWCSSAGLRALARPCWRRRWPTPPAGAC